MALCTLWCPLLWMALQFAVAERPTAEPVAMRSQDADLKKAVVDSNLHASLAESAREADQDHTRLAFDGRGLASFSQLAAQDASSKRETRHSDEGSSDAEHSGGREGIGWGFGKKGDSGANSGAIVVAGDNAGQGGKGNSGEKGGGWFSGLDILGHKAEKERLSKLAAVTEESLATALKAKQTAASPPQSPAEQPASATATWQKLLKAHEAYRNKAAPAYWKSQLNTVVADAGFGKQKGEYSDFYAKVLSMHPDHIDKVVEKAHQVVDKNHEANQKSYEYVDDLEKLANGTAQGYNKIATQQFYAYDQIFSQLKEGHMAPGKAIKVLFPLSGDVRFKPNSADLVPDSRAYFTSAFADHLKSKLKKYRGMHFTICVHSATNLQTQDVPLAFSSPEDQVMETQPDGQQMTVGVKKLLTHRAKSLEEEIHHVMTNAMGDMQVRREEYHFPTVSADMMHFDTDMPAGAVLVIAEDRLHRDDFQGSTEEEAQEHAKTVEKFDQTKCRINDFKAMSSQESTAEEARSLQASAPYSSLPQDLHEENRDTAADKSRVSSNAIVTWAEANAQLPRDQQISNSDDLVRAYDEGRQEKAKYEKVLEKGNNEDAAANAPIGAPANSNEVTKAAALVPQPPSPAPAAPSAAIVVAH